jgi:hypothetical protein
VSLSTYLNGIKVQSPEAALIELMFHYTLLTEYQLLDLQALIRHFVDRMSQAVAHIDQAANQEGAFDLETLIQSKRSEFAKEPSLVSRESVLNLLNELEKKVPKKNDIQSDVYTLIECLSFEDIQSQRLDHMAKSNSALNHAIMEKLRIGFENVSVEDMRIFAYEFIQSTRASYTMPEERAVFDQVFFSFLQNKSA